MKKYAEGSKMGFIGGDRLSEHKNLKYYIERFNLEFDKIYFAKTVEEWKRAFLSLQEEVDMAIMTRHVGIADWSDQQALAFVEAHSKIPVGTEHGWEMPLALVGVVKDFEEMGIWSAHAAFRITDGVSPWRIPITAKKKKAAIYGMLPKQLPPLACLIAPLRRCDNSYIAQLCACCRALKMNDHAAPAGQLISSAFLI